LFSGQDKERHIIARTPEKIFSNVCRAVRILESVSVHSFRHSFATYLLESGRVVGLPEIYTHVRNEDIGKNQESIE